MLVAIFTVLFPEFCLLFLYQIYEWMRGKLYFHVKAGDVALQLDLIAKVHGLEQAEKYFNGTPDSLRTFQVYGALLNCYSQNNSLEKAEAIMQKIRDMGCANTLSYNAMLGVYSRLGKHDKLDNLMQEMEKNGIRLDGFTYCLRLNAYGDTSDIEGMEKFLMKLETDPSVNSDWNAYIAAANSYLKAGLKEKAVEMLKKSEQFINGSSRRVGYEILLTLYTALGNKAELYRIWNVYKTMGKFFNSGYVCMVSSLLKLDDMDGAEKTFEEWMSGYKLIDFRVPNMLIRAYCNKGLLEKAEQVVSRMIEKEEEPTFVTWNILAAGYHENNQMDKAVDRMKKALMAIQRGRKPNPVILRACLEYLKDKGDVEVAENLIRLLREHSLVSACDSDRLMNYIRNEKPGSNSIAQMLWDHEDLDADAIVNLKQESLS